ncbi:hypothetical protein EHS39_23705 [Ensifer sp. MPMI2T]|nr:hypothetical protein EHS39_23705 [Ensifer sp. MPMI2T]
MTKPTLKMTIALSMITALSSCSFFDSEMVTACEASLQKRLRSPSEYKRFEITSYEEKLDRAAFSRYLTDDKVGAVFREAQLREFDRGTLDPTLFSLFISYDAPNAFGTPIRGIARCEYMNARGDDSGASEHDVMIDGKTYTDWLIEAVRASSN